MQHSLFPHKALIYNVAYTKLAFLFLKSFIKRYCKTNALGMILFGKLKPKIYGFLASAKELQPN